ncbi:phosphomannose isomerase type II C-terminal cupin domain [Phaeocystidibacter luteus]|uniref:Cupin domain-containing protein n=1 Tax=Phaeocystidibacter luteus TaxID=911197 RepID=A0A6N6RJN3_9FLAO|nr:phosphomannose isomerase type II C-terminal cupin domain [Phaeocystidibacter luteus]KAB2814314.1 cupin domain-containing protein [Phaeocystidibacter luteus]
MNKSSSETRPWGSYFILEESETFKVKRIEVKPGARLSYQYHFKREENWTVVGGQAKVTLDGTVHTLNVGESIFIPTEAKHRIANEGSELLVFIEVQTGSYFGEDDIVRIEDDFNRV